MHSTEQVKTKFSSAISKEYSGHKKKVHAVAWNSSGKKLASSSVDQTARIWTIEPTGQCSKELELKGHTDSVDQLCWDPTNSERVATASADKTVKIWDSKTGKIIANIPTSGENINITWSPDGNSIASGNKEDIISIIDARKYKVMKTVKFPYEVNEFSWNKEGNMLFLTTGNGTIDVLRYPEMKRETMRTLVANVTNIYCIDFDPQGKYFAVGSADALVTLWDANSLICERAFGRLDWPIRTVSFSFDGQLIASASEDLNIDISHVETGEHIFSISTEAAMNAIAWHPKEYLLAFAGDEKDKHHQRDSGCIKVFGFPPSSSSSSSTSSSSTPSTSTSTTSSSIP